MEPLRYCSGTVSMGYELISGPKSGKNIQND